MPVNPTEQWSIAHLVGEYCVDLKDALIMQRKINRRIRRPKASRLKLSFRGVKVLTPQFAQVMLVGLTAKLPKEVIIKKLLISGDKPEHIVYFAKQAMKQIALST